MPSPTILLVTLLSVSPQEPTQPPVLDSVPVAEAVEPAGFDPAARLLRSGRDALAAGRLGSAATDLRDALELAPGEAEIRRSLARALNDMGKAEAALALLDPELSVPPSAWLGVERGRALLAAGQQEPAEQAFRDALVSYPGCGGARLELGRLLTVTSRYQEAEEVVQGLLIDAPDEAAVLVLNARLFEATDRSAQAMDCLRLALDREVEDPAIRLALARLSIDAGQVEEAWLAVEPLLDQAIDIETSLQVARVALLADRQIDALALLGAALVVDPTHPAALHDMLELVEDSHLLVARLAQRRIDADLEDAYGWGELLEEYLAMDRCTEVLEALKTAPPSVMQDLEVRRHEAVALRRLGRHDEARARLEALSQGETVEVEVWYELGLLGYAEGRFQDAAKAFERSAIEGRQSADAEFNRALCLRRLERHKEAAAAFGVAVEARPAFVEAWFELGREYRFRLGDAANARRAFARYLELGGDDAEVRRWMEAEQ